ncbi:MAG: 16S rRNA (cytosine(1402)-N(4))-methyltransferase RsmH [Pseudomonadota bacterium]|nr:16S rRNA (cytosine(1402)-N(4))-methyltransferase RsmH [Pseudomonadota bacterium]
MSAGLHSNAHEARHIPVMLDEVLSALSLRDGGAYVDGTFGLGGYTRAILDGADTTVWAIDRDPEAIERGATLVKEYDPRLTLLQGRFGEMTELLQQAGIEKVDGVVLDLGVSSPQIDDAGRGFSFRFDGPLDMRMEKAGPSAADIVNSMDEGELARLIKELGEERHARRVARVIVEARNEAPITRTAELADIVRRAVPQGRSKIDPATRTFMALRLHVNGELDELEAGLRAAEEILAPGGRLVVVSFHSLEDRRVKLFMQERGGALPAGSRHLPPTEAKHPASFSLLRRGAEKPGADEIQQNPRARSARLRAAERTAAAAWPYEPQFGRATS